MTANSRTLIAGLMGVVLAIGSMQARAIEGTAAITGVVQVVDGDTLDLATGTATTRVRLFGIDARRRTDVPGWSGALMVVWSVNSGTLWTGSRVAAP